MPVVHRHSLIASPERRTPNRRTNSGKRAKAGADHGECVPMCSGRVSRMESPLTESNSNLSLDLIYRPFAIANALTTGLNDGFRDQRVNEDRKKLMDCV
ncbi:unnamed protein product [Cuscuta epithymum]|uniref:Uncharacterized protein n=1 Tax=Cuscuta epithymum TaxID=186058 RepID=A0AAV0ET14_9ASTE|nr:unnamed protein product [Cuscuta epithymum]